MKGKKADKMPLNYPAVEAPPLLVTVVYGMTTTRLDRAKEYGSLNIYNTLCRQRKDDVQHGRCQSCHV
jgi:hypothetical protein